VFNILVQWLTSLARDSDVSDVTLAYDNVCNLDKIRASKVPLPFPPPHDMLWQNVTKIIDVFHFPNHTSTVCRDKYSPESVKRGHPDWNTQAGEQTFSWLSRYKHIVTSMHHLFYIHRMVIRRNEYKSKCYRNGKKPILPKSFS